MPLREGSRQVGAASQQGGWAVAVTAELDDADVGGQVTTAQLKRGLFPALDADIRLSGDGDGSRVTLTGSYRPPLGAFGERLDRLVLHAVATATIAALLARVAAALEGVPAPAAEPDMLWQPGLGPEPASG